MRSTLYYAVLSFFVFLLLAAGGAAILLAMYGIAWVIGATWILAYACGIGLVGALASSGLALSGCLQDRDLQPHSFGLVLGWILSVAFLLAATYRILHSFGTL